MRGAGWWKGMRGAAESDDRPDDQAIGWLIARQESPDDDALSRRFEAWRRARAENAQAWSETVRAYDLIGRAAAASPLRSLGPAAGRARPAARRAILGVAALATAIAVALLLAPWALLRLEADYVTPTAESRAVRLDDGSVVRLGPESAIDVAFGRDERRVRLLEGRAFFEASPDPMRPFRVDAGEVEVAVVGTAFDVLLRRDGAEIGVRRGEVRVDLRPASSSSTTTELLTAGERLQVAWRGSAVRRRASPSEIGSWLDGKLIARDRPVAEVVDELRRYYAGAILLADEELGRRSVTGVYNLADPMSALAAVAHAHGGRVLRLSPWLAIVTKG